MRVGKRKRCASNENLNLIANFEFEESFSSSSSLMALNLNDINQELGNYCGSLSASKKSKLNSFKSFEYEMSTRLGLSQHNNSKLKLNDISNSSATLSAYLSDINNYKEKPHTLSKLDKSNIVAAKSSYFSLTPASSTTSLNDLNLINEPVDSNQRVETNEKSVASNKSSSLARKRPRQAHLKTQLNEIDENEVKVSNTKKTEPGQDPKPRTTRRGRPPKSGSKNPKIDKYVVSKITEKENDDTTTSEPVKLTNQRSCSNLQKSKVLNQKNSVLTESPSSNEEAPKEAQTDKEQGLLNNLNLFYSNYYKLKTENEQSDTFFSDFNSKQTPLPSLNWADSHDLWRSMRMSDVKYTHDPAYTRKHLGIEPQMRAILLDWLVEISYAYRLHRETYHLAIEYLDRFMSVCTQQMRIDRLQLIGLTSLYLASKNEEIYPPKLAEFASHMENYSTNNEDAMAKFELFFLKSLNWQISPVTANTWLMTYLQIASLNYSSLISNKEIDLEAELAKIESSETVFSTSLVMPVHLYKNSDLTNLKMDLNENSKQFYLKNYMKSVTLIDLCMFDMESLRFDYSMIAASALYHMLTNELCHDQNKLAACLVEKCTGFRLFELDLCIKWMYPYSDVCKEILTDERMTFIKQFSNVDQDDSHNIQLYYQNLDLLKEAQSRKTPSKFYTNPLLLTPPDSHRKYPCQSSSASSCVSASTSFASSAQSTPNCVPK